MSVASMEVVESAGYTLNGEQFERFRAFVRKKAGIALRDEKKQLVCSRLTKRLRALSLNTFDEYYTLLVREGDHGGELEQLLNVITTNKTNFYREAHHFTELVERVVKPKLDHDGTLQLRIWSAGCSSGEEIYTALWSVLDAVPGWERSDIRALASDLDTDVLATGERGVYDEACLSDVPAEIARRWLIRGSGEKGGLVRVKRALRERVRFRRINFIDPRWPVNAKFDAVFCRNALIYFDQDVQREIVSRLLSYLKPGGFLFLGHSESMAGVRPDLKSYGKTVYEHLGATT
ncbi:MAG TPA: CheR family methyltransferase [Polyangiales bacterium]|nr:CheR family methyltransferase [Polyangiales bacterium]